MSLRTKDGKEHDGPVTDTHDGFVRVGYPGHAEEVFSKSEVEKMWDVKDEKDDKKK